MIIAFERPEWASFSLSRPLFVLLGALHFSHSFELRARSELARQPLEAAKFEFQFLACESCGLRARSLARPSIALARPAGQLNRNETSRKWASLLS